MRINRILSVLEHLCSNLRVYVSFLFCRELFYLSRAQLKGQDPQFEYTWSSTYKH